MAYTKQNFTDGMKLTAEHLTNMEEGILSGTLIEIKESSTTTLSSAQSLSTCDGYVMPSQTIGSAITFGSHSTSCVFEIPANASVFIEPLTGGSYGFAITDENDLVLEYTTNSSSYTFKTYDQTTRLWASVPKLGLTQYTLLSTRTVSLEEHEERLNNIESMVTNGGNYWTGKTIWWCGTSIPAGGYPELVGEMLGAEMINTAVGGSMCRANVRTGDYNGANISNITSSLSMTAEEAENFITNYDTLRQLSNNTSWPETLGTSYENRIRSGTFEVKLMPYLDGTNPMPDLWIIDHSHNDWKYKDSSGNIDITLAPTRENIDSGELAEDVFMTETIDGVEYARLKSFLGSFDNINPDKLDDFVCSLNRNCYYGALNFICTVILAHNPRARFMVIGNYSNENVGETSYAALIPAQQSWAADWGFPFCDISNCFGASANHIIPGTKEYDSENHTATFDYDITLRYIYTPDGVHPSSDGSGYALNVYAGILSEFIKQHR